MSVTFTATNAPRTTTPCRWCVEARDNGTGHDNGHGGCCNPWCPGTVSTSTAPEVNLSNINAAGMLRLLHLPTDNGIMWGSLDCAHLPALRASIMRALNRDRSHLVVNASSTPAGSAGVRTEVEGNVVRLVRLGPAVHNCGNTDEQTVRRLRDLDALATWAQVRGLGLSWD